MLTFADGPDRSSRVSWFGSGSPGRTESKLTICGSGAREPTADEVRDLCNQVSEIKILPMKQIRRRDATFDAFMEAGVRVIPCLIEKVTDETPMPDPCEAPKYDDTRVGDVAYFLICDITQVDFVMLMPPEVEAKYRDQGVYAYFEFVENPKNRKRLQESREWYRETFAASYGKALAKPKTLCPICVQNEQHSPETRL